MIEGSAMNRRTDRGAALILALFLMTLLELLGMAYLRTVYEDLRATRDRVRFSRALHAAEGAFEVLAARRDLAAGTHEVVVGPATVRVTAVPDGPGWRLEAAVLESHGNGTAWTTPEAGVEGSLRPRASGAWRLSTRFR